MQNSEEADIMIQGVTDEQKTFDSLEFGILYQSVCNN